MPSSQKTYLSYPGWIVELCVELRRSYSTSELSEQSQLLEEQTKVIKDPQHRHDERSCVEALAVIGHISKSETHYKKALSYEGEVDYTNAHREPYTVYPTNVIIIQDAYNEIFEGGDSYPEDLIVLSKSCYRNDRTLSETCSCLVLG